MVGSRRSNRRVKAVGNSLTCRKQKLACWTFAQYIRTPGTGGVVATPRLPSRRGYSVTDETMPGLVSGWGRGGLRVSAWACRHPAGTPRKKRWHPGDPMRNFLQ